MRISSVTTALLALAATVVSAAEAPSLGLILQDLLGDKICLKPAVRKEWRKLSKKQQEAWVAATLCIQSQPHTKTLTSTRGVTNIVPPINQTSTLWDDYTFLHIDLNHKFHYTGLFFPWHRFYIQQFYNDMEQKCGYKGPVPYWDWRIDAADVLHTTMWDEDPKNLGGWGTTADDDWTVHTGAYTKTWLAYPVPHLLRRQMQLQAFKAAPQSALIPEPARFLNTTLTRSHVQKALDCPDLHCLQTMIEGLQNIHGAGHSVIGGDHGGLCPKSAPPTCVPGPYATANEPIFWMHHAMVDKLWYEWQMKSFKNLLAIGGGLTQNLANFTTFPTGAPPAVAFDSMMPADGLFQEWPVKDVQTTLSSKLCYVYE